MSWEAAFDVFHALPEGAFARAHGSHSSVTRMTLGAIQLAQVLHATTIPMQFLFGIGAEFGAWYNVGVVIAAALPVYEHRMVIEYDFSRVRQAFFQMNASLSATVFVFALVDRVVQESCECARVVAPDDAEPGRRTSRATTASTSSRHLCMSMAGVSRREFVQRRPIRRDLVLAAQC